MGQGETLPIKKEIRENNMNDKVRTPRNASDVSKFEAAPAANSNNTSGGTPEELEAMKKLVEDANNRAPEKLPARGAGVDPTTHHSSVKQVKNAHRKLARRGLVGSLKSFAREQIATTGPEAEDAKVWMKNKKELAQKNATPGIKIVKKSKSEKEAAKKAA